MPIPLALLGGLASAAPGVFQGITGLFQGRQANRVKVQDTRPQSFLEELALRRQQANSQRFAGQGTAENNIRQSAANSMSAAQQAGTGASGVLAAATRVNQNTNASFGSLADRAAAYQEQNRDRLSGALRQDAAYRQNDQENANRERASLRQARATNLFGMVSTLGSVGAYATGGGFKANPETGISNFVSQQSRPAIDESGGLYNPNQPMPLGVGWLGRIHGASNGVWRR